MRAFCIVCIMLCLYVIGHMAATTKGCYYTLFYGTAILVIAAIGLVVQLWRKNK